MQPSPVFIADYSPNWPLWFEQERLALAKLFPLAAIEHIGSTAVRGLAAKPVIDILLGAASLDQIEAQIGSLARLALAYFPQHERVLPQRRYFARPAAAGPAVHLHAVVRDSAFWIEHLAFRDALRLHADVALDYAALKRRLAAEFGHDWAGYTDAKAPFIRRVLAHLESG